MLALEARLRLKLDLKLPVVRWLIRHAAFIITRYQVGHDGHTAWRRLTGKAWNGTVVVFGEQVFGNLSLKRPATERKVTRGKRKVFERSVQRTWLGIHARTGEHVIALPSGEAIRVRTIHRLSGDARWSPKAVLAVCALPRRPVRSVTTQTPSPGRPGKNTELRVANRPTLVDLGWIDRRWQSVRKCPANFESTADFWRSSAIQTTVLVAFSAT